jgi:hypothetical protein
VPQEFSATTLPAAMLGPVTERPWRDRLPFRLAGPDDFSQSPSRGFNSIFPTAWPNCRSRRLRPQAVEPLVDFARDPQPMQQDRQLAGDYGSALSVLAAAAGQLQAPSSQTTVRRQRTQHIVRGLHQQPAQVAIAALGDTELRRAFGRGALQELPQ